MIRHHRQIQRVLSVVDDVVLRNSLRGGRRGGRGARLQLRVLISDG